MPGSRWNGSSYISIDPGIKVTGFACYRVSLNGIAGLFKYGAVIPPDSIECEHARIAYIVDTISGLVNDIRPAFVQIEQPPYTIYQGKRLKAAMLIAKAQSVFKTVAVCFAIMATIRQTAPRVGRVPVLPVQWQENSKKHKGLTSKEWSLREANKILVADMQRQPNLLSTEREENIADAIVLGRRAFDAGFCPH